MDTKAQLEKVLEHLLNEEEDKAVDLLKKVFITRGRAINEEIMADEEDVVETILDQNELEEDDMSDLHKEVKAEEYFGEDEGDEATEDGNPIEDVLLDAKTSLEHLQQLFDEINDRLGEVSDDNSDGDESEAIEMQDDGEEVTVDNKTTESEETDDSTELDEDEILEFSILDESFVEDLEVVKAQNKNDFVGAKTGDTDKLSTNTTSPVASKKTQGGPVVTKKPTESIPAVGEAQHGPKVADSGVKSKFVRKSATDNTKVVK